MSARKKSVPIDFLCTSNISYQQYGPASITNLYLDEETCDVHFFINNDENQGIPAHKCILSASSTVFQQMFYGPLRETGDINIVDASYSEFKEFLKAFYLCNMQIQSENVVEIFMLADKYDVLRLKEFCYHFLTNKFTINIFFRSYELATKFDLMALKTMCYNKIHLHASDILKSPYIVECSRETLKDIVKLAGFYCQEIFIMEQLMEWAKKSCEYSDVDPTLVNCRNALGDVFNFINFTDMSSEEFQLCQQKYPDLLNTEECEKIINTIRLRYDVNYRITSIKTSPLYNFVVLDQDEITPYDFALLRRPLWRSIFCYGYKYCSMIQQYAIPSCSKKENVIFQAPFGAGKTSTLCISILQQIDMHLFQCQVLILSPTTELAERIKKFITVFSYYMGLKCLLLNGLSNTKVQVDVRKMFDIQIVIGTPNRLLDLIKRYKVLSLKRISMFVLDDADELITRGFKNEIYEIRNMLPERTKTLLSSTRISADLLKLISTLVGDPTIFIDRSQNLNSVKQYYIILENEERKVTTLCNWYKAMSVVPAVVFCCTSSTVVKVVRALKKRHVVVASLQDNLKPSEQKAILSYFKNGSIRVLVTTDHFLRSINILSVQLVFNVDLPSKLENYIRRLGRVGQFGQSCVVINLITKGERRRLKDIEQFHDTSIIEVPAGMSS